MKESVIKTVWNKRFSVNVKIIVIYTQFYDGLKILIDRGKEEYIPGLLEVARHSPQDEQKR